MYQSISYETNRGNTRFVEVRFPEGGSVRAGDRMVDRSGSSYWVVGGAVLKSTNGSKPRKVGYFN
jgi:hypothetical protein